MTVYYVVYVHLTLILLLHYLVKCRRRSSAVYNNESILSSGYIAHAVYSLGVFFCRRTRLLIRCVRCRYVNVRPIINYCFIVLAAARIDKGPDNIGAQVDSNVELKCLLHHKSCDDVIWTKTELTGSTQVLYAGNILLQSYGGRYSVNVSHQRECPLHINRLQFSDAGAFTCVDAVAGASPQLKKTAIITVAGIYVV